MLEDSDLHLLCQLSYNVIYFTNIVIKTNIVIMLVLNYLKSKQIIMRVNTCHF